MKLLIKNIKLHIEQLDNIELTRDFLSKLHLNSSYLSDLWNKDSQVSIDLFTSLFPGNSLHHGFLEQTKLSLNDLRSVWPLINQIIEQPQHLIELLKKSSSEVLEALQRLDLSKDWNLLIQVLLTKDENTAERNRWELINFLRRFSWLEELKACKGEAQGLFTLCFQILAFTITDVLERRLQNLSAFCEEYPFVVAYPCLNQFITAYSTQLAEEQTLITNKEFIRVLDRLINNLNRQEQKILIKEWNVDNLAILITHCIENVLLLEPVYQEAYKRILFILCTQSVDLEEPRQVIQKSLNQVEDEVEADPPERVWYPLEQVIFSPGFKNKITVLTIEKLLLRYRYLILTLNPKELIYFIVPAKELSPYYERLLSQLMMLHQQLAQAPEQKNLLTQRDGIFDWCIERASHALLAELIRQAKQQNNQAVLTAVFIYYYEHCRPLRGDLREAALSHFYNLANLSVSNTIDHWRQEYLQRKKQTASLQCSDPYLYNEQGQCIGFIDEANTAWNLIDEPPRLVTDEQKRTGYFNNSTRRHTLSAQLLSLVPTEELERSSMGLSLLIQDVLSENTLDLVYQQLELNTANGSLKRLWLERVIAKTICDAPYSISFASLSSLICHVREDEICFLWTNTSNRKNAFSFFHSILWHDPSRELLFSGHYLSSFLVFLNKHDPIAALADYLIHAHKKPWFLEGIALFARYGQEFGLPFLLADAAAELANQVQQAQLSVELLDDVLFSLINSSDAARVLLQEFAQDELAVSVQLLRRPELERLCPYFNKQQLIFLVRTLNLSSSWHNEPLYRLTLIILQSQLERLLLAATTKWSNEELCALSLFINRHLLEKNSWDNQSSLGFKCLGFLLFYCSAAGQTNLFFNQDGKLSRLTAYSVTPAVLTRLVDDFALSASPEQKSHLKIFFAVNDEELPINGNTSSKSLKNIPVLGVYLLHYRGAAAPLEQLLVHYFITYAGKEALTHPISAFLLDFPERDVSASIFDSLQKLIINNPKRLDATRFTHLAQYYVHQQKLSYKDEIEAKIHLLRSWGQTGDYSLVNQGCLILLTLCQDEALNEKIKKAEVESRLEAELKTLIEKPSLYTSTIKWCKRFWHYGPQWTKNRSQLLVFADESATTAPQFFSTAMITVPKIQSKEEATPSIAQSYIHLLSEIVRSAANTEKELLGKTKQTLFAGATSPIHILPEVASKPVRAHV